ncbi:hypothetical protein ZIOFF_067552 [Zingiber officinale]|uniref:Uncharacterized protein n=1 Tax=Zingiber officinale TaxID=94328 RepID=A0A8J5C5W8_ZINOF|nr:hypothetical protein ZIOFF_067552 [Zingiber officinale]
MAFFSIPRPISPSPPLLLTKCRPFFRSQITRVPASPTLLRHRIPPPPAASPELEAVEEDEKFPTPLLGEESDVAASVEVLKAAAKTRKAPPAQVLAALASIKKGKAEPSSFLETLGGTESPGRTWMLIFTAQGKLDKGRYFPITAVQRFDAANEWVRMATTLFQFQGFVCLHREKGIPCKVDAFEATPNSSLPCAGTTEEGA